MVDRPSVDVSVEKQCFVVSAFGSTAEEQTRTKQVLRHLIRKVLTPRGYSVVRADEIDDEGLITNQIIEHLLDDHLVVADLSGRNPNVFYEVAVRHAARKPIIHLISVGESIPFDIANMRAVSYALDDPDLLEQAQQELDRKAAAIEASDGEAALNPITVARNVALLRGSDEPEARVAGDVLSALNDLRDDVRSLSRRVASEPASTTRLSLEDGVDHRSSAVDDKRRLEAAIHRLVSRMALPSSEVPEGILMTIISQGPLPVKALASYLHCSQATISRYVKPLQDAEVLERRNGVWTLHPGFRGWLEKQ